MKKRKILAISGSTRKRSTNEIILKTIAALYKDVLNIHFYDGIDQLPHFNPDLDNENVASLVKDFRKLVEEVEGVIICTPEYVFSLPGTLKNALEWTVSTTVFSDKPFAYIVASANGEKAFEALDLIMSTLLQYKIPEKSKLLIKGGKGKVNEKGEIADPKILQEIKEVVDSLILSVETKKY
jgi:chromate reductase, NAD(P)H dehydrogenase (quinone)